MSDISQTSTAATTPTGGRTGTICNRTGPYKASDGRIEIVVLVKKGDKYPAFGGGTGTTSVTWSPVGSGDSSRGGFTAIKVEAGTL
jgi:hypothetical protein